MTTPLASLVTAFARRKNAHLGPDWPARAATGPNAGDPDALRELCEGAGWNLVQSTRKPRAHHLPLLVWLPELGWGIAETWTSQSRLRIATAEAAAEVEYESGLTFWDIHFPGTARSDDAPRAIDVFWRALLRRKSMFVDATIATIVINLIALATSIYSMQVYDRVIPRAGFSTLIVLTGGMIVALIVDMLIRNTRAFMIDREAGLIDSEVSEYFYARMQAVRLDARPRSIGTMAAQLRGTDQVRSLLSAASLFILADLPFAFLFMGAIAWIGGVVALVPLVTFPLALLLAGLMARLIRTHAASTLVTGNRKNGLLVEALDSAETIKANNGGWHMLAGWNRLVAEVHGHELRVKRWSTLSGSAFSFIQQLAYVGVVCVGAFEVVNGHMTMGGVIACSILSGRVNGPLVAALPNLIIQWSYARSSLVALDGILKLPSDQPENREMLRQTGILGDIHLENVKFYHQGSRQGLSVASLRISPGEKVGIIGPVGSGKSTLLRLLAGLYAPQEGQILLDGIDVTQIAKEDLHAQICYLPQDYRLIPGTLRDNLTLGLPTPQDQTILDAARKTGLDELIKKHPLGLDLPIAEGGSGLSGGQRVQVGLTRLLLTKPRVLLLDEPTANLDQESEARALQAVVQAIGPQCSFIFVTHKVQLASLAERLMVVADGQIVLDGPTPIVLEKLRPNGPQHSSKRGFVKDMRSD